MIDPQTATVADAVDELYGEQGDGLTLDYTSEPAKIERAARRVVRCATPFDSIRIGLLQAELMQDPYRAFGPRFLKPLVKGIISEVVRYQKNARAAARLAAKKSN